MREIREALLKEQSPNYCDIILQIAEDNFDLPARRSGGRRMSQISLDRRCLSCCLAVVARLNSHVSRKRILTSIRYRYCITRSIGAQNFFHFDSKYPSNLRYRIFGLMSKFFLHVFISWLDKNKFWEELACITLIRMTSWRVFSSEYINIYEFPTAGHPHLDCEPNSLKEFADSPFLLLSRVL